MVRDVHQQPRQFASDRKVPIADVQLLGMLRLDTIAAEVQREEARPTVMSSLQRTALPASQQRWMAHRP
jgi:hypothetical protein